MRCRHVPAALLVVALLAGCAREAPDRLLAAAPPTAARPIFIQPIPVGPVTPARQDPVPSGGPTSAIPTVAAPTQPSPTAPPTPKPPSDKAPDCSKLKCVALTMDDGPVPGTAAVLDLLKRKRVHATFFLVGENAAIHPRLVRRMVREGNVVGSHSWNHPEFFGLKAKRLQRQLVRTDTVLRRATGHDPVLMRPPFGEVTPKVQKSCRALGEAVVLWDVDPRDWKDRKAKTVVKRVLKQARRGSIILTHDSLKSTRKAYPQIIDGLRKRGFTLVTVPQLFAGRMHAGKVYLRG